MIDIYMFYMDSDADSFVIQVYDDDSIVEIECNFYVQKLQRT